MRLPLLALACGLASFAAVWALASAVAAAALRAALPADPAAAARRLFLARALPTLAAVAVAVGLAVPAFLLFEPADAVDRPGATLLLLAAAGAGLLLFGLLRGGRAWWSGRRLRGEWLRRGRPVALEGAPAPGCLIEHPFPVVCVVGVLRPRLFLAASVLERLSAGELRATLAHEAAHVAAGDNLKRLLLRLCPPLSAPSGARRAQEMWQQASEEAADRRAGGGLEMASALLAIARMAGPGARLGVPGAAFHTGGPLERRVRRLAEDPAAEPPPASRWRWLLAAGLSGGLVFLAQALGASYRIVEALVGLP
jgi:Zn-dependent protease with chaperone function